MDDLIAGFRTMPTFAQVGMIFFALMVLVMLFGPGFGHRRVAARFAELAKACNASLTPGEDKFAASFEVERDSRRFTVRRMLRDSTSGPSYRGPRGHLLICETPLAPGAWAHYNVDIAEKGSLPPVGSRPFVSGDAAFDRRFKAWEDGTPVRSGWLDAAVRNAVTAFFDATPLSGSLWVREGRLQYVAVAPKGIDAPALDRVLGALAMVAQAFERVAES
jgi:hypothetical protein